MVFYLLIYLFILNYYISAPQHWYLYFSFEKTGYGSLQYIEIFYTLKELFFAIKIVHDLPRKTIKLCKFFLNNNNSVQYFKFICQFSLRECIRSRIRNSVLYSLHVLLLCSYF